MLNIFETCQALTQLGTLLERIYGLMKGFFIKIYCLCDELESVQRVGAEQSLHKKPRSRYVDT